MSELTQDIVQETIANKEEESILAPDPAFEPVQNKKGHTLFLVGLVLLGVLALVVATLFSGANDPSLTKAPDAALTSRVDRLEKRVEGIEKKGASAPVAQTQDQAQGAALTQPVLENTVPEPRVGADEILKLKDGLAGLSQALAVLHAELEKSSQEANETRHVAQSGVATVLAFTEMQRRALRGLGFEKERQTLRGLAGDDSGLIERLVKLEPVALTGAPPAAALQKEWTRLSAEAQTALRKAGAQSWFDRLVVAIEGLVSIRSLNPQAGDTMSFASVALELEQDNLPAALEHVAAMPQEVQLVVKDWHAKLESRLALEQTLDDLFAYLIGRGKDGSSVDQSAAVPVAPAASSVPVEPSPEPVQ